MNPIIPTIESVEGKVPLSSWKLCVLLNWIDLAVPKKRTHHLTNKAQNIECECKRFVKENISSHC